MVKSARRVTEILDYVSKKRSGCSHSELTQAIEVPKSSLTELLSTLEQSGYLVFNEATHHYVLGAKVLQLASSYLNGVNVISLGTPAVKRLFDRYGEFSALTVRHGTEVAIVCEEHSSHPLAHAILLGQRLPVYASASGKVILAFMAPHDREALLDQIKFEQLTAKTITNRALLNEEMQTIREKGVAYHDAEVIDGINSVAAPIFDILNEPIAALSIACPKSRFEDLLKNNVIEKLQAEATHLTSLLGGSYPKA
jgi:DNA-binding IclR family transcriptional regulator